MNALTEFKELGYRLTELNREEIIYKKEIRLSKKMKKLAYKIIVIDVIGRKLKKNNLYIGAEYTNIAFELTEAELNAIEHQIKEIWW